jgi:homoserine kinase
VSAADARSPRLGLARDEVVVEVPATTANLGAGFDCLALALDLCNTLHVALAPDLPHGSVRLEVAGEGRGHLPRRGADRFSRGLRGGLGALGIDADRLAWRVRMDNAIPISRGLGSSASATVGGLLAAEAFAGRSLGEERLLALATAAEGHPDNAAAALLGGFVVVNHEGAEVRAVRFEPPRALLAVLFIPDRPLSTASMRAALPGSVPFADAVHNVAASALAVAAFATGRLDLLARATDDRLHEPYRAAVYPELPRLTAAARAAGALGACLSGAGSSVIAFVDRRDAAERVGEAMAEHARRLDLPGGTAVLRPRSRGAIVR